MRLAAPNALRGDEVHLGRGKRRNAMTDHYSILFEPVRIGPVTARNRFYQVPHCNGLGHLRPRAEAAMRGIKAEGGWAVVATQETEIHPTSDLAPYPENRLWDSADIPALRLMTEAVQAHGSLAAVELVHNGHYAQNLLSRMPGLGPSDLSNPQPGARQARAMDKSDIRDLRRWHRAAAIRARDAGFDIIYVYAGHHLCLPQHFLLPHLNSRCDEYGGSLENRVRLTRELLEDTHDAVGDQCAVAFRFAVDEMLGDGGMQAVEEGRAVVEMLAELPDLWDVNVSDWSNDSATSRFEPHGGYQTGYTSFVKQLTSKPVVGVGRFTSPDLMAKLVREGVLDLIGAARPSIADPFLPNKIREGRIDEIRECIGCNVCVTSDMLGVPIRCTQNPTMGEEWRRGWHPEIISPRASDAEALVVGAGPAGLECAMSLARRGYRVTLAEASREAGGRALRESNLPGLSAWRRVIDYRLGDLRQRANASLYLESPMTAAAVRELGVANVFIATGSEWRRDGAGRSALRGLPMLDPAACILTPDDLLNGTAALSGPVLVYDDDRVYLGGVLAELLVHKGHEVIYATPAATVSEFTWATLEQDRIQRRLIELGVRIECNRKLASVSKQAAHLACVYSDREIEVACCSVVLVTERARRSAVYDELRATGWSGHLELIGDAQAPGLIADAVWSGHKAARDFECSEAEVEAGWFRRELVDLTGEARP